MKFILDNADKDQRKNWTVPYTHTYTHQSNQIKQDLNEVWQTATKHIISLFKRPANLELRQIGQNTSRIMGASF